MPFSVILVFKSFMVRSSSVFLILLPKRTVLYCYFHMYCTLTDPKFFRRLSYCRFCFYYVMCNLHCTFFDIILQRKIPRRHHFYSVCGGFLGYYTFFTSFSFLLYLQTAWLNRLNVSAISRLFLLTRLQRTLRNNVGNRRCSSSFLLTHPCRA